MGGTRQYNAAVTGLSSTAVTWSVSGPGSIDPMMGLYSAPPVGSISVPATVTVTATAVADPPPRLADLAALERLEEPGLRDLLRLAFRSRPLKRAMA